MGVMRRVIECGAILGAALMVTFVAEVTEASPVTTPGDREILGLETEAALRPDAEQLGELAQAYLLRDEPGLAQATVERARLSERGDPQLRLVEARALLALGRASAARDALRAAEERCREQPCADHVQAKLQRHLVLTEAMLTAGLEDAASDPDSVEFAMACALPRLRQVGHHAP